VSRAFLSESDDAFMEDDVPEVKLPLPPGVKNYMTPEGAERMGAELNELVSVTRPELLTQISQSVADGASLEKEAMLKRRRRLREVERRIEYLTRMADIVEVVDPEKQDPARVLFGAAVTVDEEGKGERVYRIVGLDESDPGSGRVSWVSPVAKALIGKRVGDAAVVKRPAGDAKMKVVKVEYK